MLEELNSSCLWDMCCGIRDRTPMVYPKGRTWGKKIDPWNEFFDQADTHLRWDILPMRKRLDGRSFRSVSDVATAWRWFNSNADKIIDGYLKDKWNNDMRKAMTECKTYNALHEDWLKYFNDRRAKFMDKANSLIDGKVKELQVRNKLPQSHGGVANLLKILTRTMKEQGSGIDSIAKMQYAICVQAGIYIVPEFLTDVLVAKEIMNNEGK